MLLRGRQHVVAIFALVFLCGCGDQRGESASSQTRSGIRLAVLSPACAIILRDLDREQKIVGRHGWDLALDPSIPVAGDQNGLDYETLLRLDPTDIVLEQSAKEIPDRLDSYAQTKGWRVHLVPMLTLGDVREAIGVMDRVSVGSQSMTEKGEQLLASFERAVSPDDFPCGSFGRTLPITFTDPVGVMGPGSFHADLLSSLGATPIPEEGAPYISLDTEDVIRLDPETIVLFMPGRDPDAIEEALGPLSDIGLRAVEEGRVVLIDHEHALTPSTALIDIAHKLASAGVFFDLSESFP